MPLRSVNLTQTNPNDDVKNTKAYTVCLERRIEIMIFHE